MSSPVVEIRPKHSSFVWARVAPVVVTFGLVALVATVALSFAGVGEFAWIPPVMAVACVGLALALALAAVGKERYEFGQTGIVARSGGLLSDREANLEFRNVTHVRQRLPWIRYRFFGVGDVIVDSAGSSGSAVVLRSVRDPDAVTDRIRERLRTNGFSMRRMTLLHDESPDNVGVAVEVLGLAVGLVFGLAFALVSIVADMAGGFDAALEILDPKSGRLPTVARIGLFYALPTVLPLGGGVTLVLRYLDLSRRRYRIFDDEVVYEEGFLDRTNAFMPFENIADADEVKTVIDRVLGLSDVTVSCQGSGQEVKFRRLKRGPAMKAAIAHLVASSGEKARATAPRAERPDARPKVMPPAPGLVSPDAAWTAQLQPVPMRAVASLIGLLPIVPVWLVATVATWVRVGVTRYTVGPTSIGLRTGLFSVTEREYAYDKVTGVRIKSTPLDRLFDTMTIQVWSIGSTMPLDLAHVPRNATNLPRLLRNLGIEQSPPARIFETRFGPRVWAQSAIVSFIVWGLLALALASVPVVVTGDLITAAAIGVVPIGFVAAYVWRQLQVEKQRCTLHGSHVELQQGVWWREHTYARYDDVKKVAVRRYPGGSAGDLQIFVAGERIVQQGNNGGAVPMPYSMTARFLPMTDDLGLQIDEVLEGVRDPGDARPASAQSVVLERRPHLGQTMVGALVAAVVLLPFAPLILPWSWVAARRIGYRLEPNRIVHRRGVLYRTETSMLLERIDSLEQTQGAGGKLFGTGTITLFTAGSSRPDLALGALPDHGRMHAAIRKRYGG